MAHKAKLRTTAANKKRSVACNDVFCCLEIDNKLLYHWHLNCKLVPIVTQINQDGVDIDGCKEEMKPLLRESKEVISGSLEDRLRSKGRQLSSTLAHSTKRKRESLLEKSFIIDVKVQDIVPISEILSTMDQLR